MLASTLTPLLYFLYVTNMALAEVSVAPHSALGALGALGALKDEIRDAPRCLNRLCSGLRVATLVSGARGSVRVLAPVSTS